MLHYASEGAQIAKCGKLGMTTTTILKDATCGVCNPKSEVIHREVKVHMFQLGRTVCSRWGQRRTERWDRVTCQVCLSGRDGKWKARVEEPAGKTSTGNGILKCRICGEPYRDHVGFQTCGTPPVTPVKPSELSGWRADAACLGTDTSLWLLESPGQSSKKAKAICARCPVQRECAEYAVTGREMYGLWGGISVKTRQQRRNQRVA